MTEIQIPNEAKLKYIERRKKDLADCRQALLTEDFGCFERIGHQVKGNAVTFGFDQLTSVAVDMETAAQKKDLQSLITIVDRFELLINQL